MRIPPLFPRHAALPFLTHSRLAAVAIALAAAGTAASTNLTVSAAGATTLEYRTAASTDDAEESPTGSVYLNSSDLELVHDTSDQTVGMRWTGVTIPPGATITAAYVQFSAKEAQSEATSLAIRGQAADNPATFGSAKFNVSTRPRTTATASWAPAPWTAGAAGAAQRTPDLSAVIQEIVSRPGWASGNALVLVIDGTGHRTARAWDGGATSAPLLHLEYVTGPPPPDLAPVARLTAAQVASPALTVAADGSASTDTDLTPIAAYQFDFGDGTPPVTTTAPTATATHTYAIDGTYTVTLIVTDTGLNASTPASASVTVNPPPPPPPDLAPVARLSVAQIASPPLTASADGSASTDTDLTPIATYNFDFGDGTPAVTTTAPAATATHTYAAAGNYLVTLIVTDTALNESAPATATIGVTAAPPVTLERRTAASSDDAEEFANGTVYLASSDLELVHDTSDQTVGMRWAGVTIPPGATITAAYIQFSAREAQSEVTNLTIRGQAADNPATFATTARDISTRPRTAAATSWAPAPWTAGAAGAAQRTPDLSAVIQEIVSRPGWASGNALVLIVNGTGHRTAWAWNGNKTGAPLLHVEYLTGPPPENPPVARLSLTRIANPPLSVIADASASTDIDLTPIATYRFDFGDGTPAVTTTAPTATATHTYAAEGTYTVTLIVTDNVPSASAPATATVTVSPIVGPPIAVHVGYYDTHHPDNPKPRPDPWMGSPGVVFVGTPDSPSGGWDSSALRLDNLSGGTLSGVVVTVDIGSNRFALWGTRSIPAGGKLILAQTGFENFDGSDTNPAGCYGCDPADCLTLVQSTVPVVHVTIGGTTTDYLDTGQILNTHGVDAAGCPYVGGPLPQTRYDESEAWQQIYPGPLAANRATAAGAEQSRAAAGGPLQLATPYPNPTQGEFAIRFRTAVRGPVRLDVYDVTGRLVKTCLDRVLDPGDYRKIVDLRGAGAGVYFCYLRTAEGALHRTFVLTQ